LTGEEEGGGGPKSNDGEIAWSSINHSILFDAASLHGRNSVEINVLGRSERICMSLQLHIIYCMHLLCTILYIVNTLSLAHHVNTTTQNLLGKIYKAMLHIKGSVK
jgi:hypothetical protein